MSRRPSLVLLLVAALALVTTTAAAAPTAPTPGASDWPMFHRDVSHSGTSPETGVTAQDAATLGIAWQQNTGAGTNTSPAVAWSAVLDRTLVYTASKNHVVSAYDALTGERVWYFQTMGELSSSPAVVDGVVYIGSDDHRLYALDAATGAKRCSFDTGGVINASPLVVDPGDGLVVYVGDNGHTGASDGGHIWAINAVDPNPAVDCSLKWQFDQFGEPAGSQPLAGSWSPPSWVTTADGRHLVVAGSSSPDCAVYALDPQTGARVWRFETVHTSFDSDVGAGTTVSAPGVNGFADGVVYAIGKNHVLSALDPGTGTQLWEYDVDLDSPGFVGSTRSTPALAGNRVFFGYGEGLYAVDATTGQKLWRLQTPARLEVISSPAVVGPDGAQVVLFTDLSGRVFAADAATGQLLWSYQTGGYTYSSPAVSNGTVYVGSSDGFLYAFALGGGTSGKPTATVTAPTDGATLANPVGGLLTITGTAEDDRGVQEVRVAVKKHLGGTWWNASTSSWARVFGTSRATLASPGARSTTWTIQVPVAPTGGGYTVQAEAVDADGQHTAPVAQSRVAILSTSTPPDTTITSPTRKTVFSLPTPLAPTTVTLRGTATDTAGAHPGVDKVYLVIKNKEHNEYYCGSLGCGGAPDDAFGPQRAVIAVTPDRPGATSTTWSYTFTTMDHPHNYGVQAYARDLDGESDPSKASVSPICVRLPGQTCAGALG
ncbi:PQQ-binding-like beta-propeller repeat protein [Lapillicoccus jejuensis]|uniref:Outer membrane protein assembly factor BamB n=1 Tax=Lapillicoccus jejuensis TaxID=402171 RepID=A0A542E355_9MICO|nr:PQQ-binding-like beta-propeller repeat protein [Lapillicoccus jejuensis]TQJ09761.1 outer membrane protein assembly factor BamB [Lapillicoccus jejuensis]